MPSVHASTYLWHASACSACFFLFSMLQITFLAHASSAKCSKRRPKKSAPGLSQQASALPPTSPASEHQCTGEPAPDHQCISAPEHQYTTAPEHQRTRVSEHQSIREPDHQPVLCKVQYNFALQFKKHSKLTSD